MPPMPDLPIETGFLRLRHLIRADAPRLHELSLEPAYREWLSNQVYDDLAAAEASVAWLVDQCAVPGDPRTGPYVLAVDHRADDRLIGHVGFSPYLGEVEIGFAIAAAYQGRGLGTEVVRAGSLWVLRRFGLERVVGVAAAGNIASRRVMARAGFRHESDRDVEFQGRVQPVAVYVFEDRAADA
jgi:ribosomal-protein-alanine N-acetyltransferase